jgi:aminoglycoside phosphotransferase (APT) family kinase protein
MRRWTARRWASASSATRPSPPSGPGWRGAAARCWPRSTPRRLDRLPPLATSDARGELARYEAIYRQFGAERPVFEAAFRWLEGSRPPPPAPVLVHGDFRNGNLMIHPDGGLVGVLDWELAHLGDPAEDLGWICVNSWRFGEWRKPVGGFGDYQACWTATPAGGREIAGRGCSSGRPWAR